MSAPETLAEALADGWGDDVFFASDEQEPEQPDVEIAVEEVPEIVRRRYAEVGS